MIGYDGTLRRTFDLTATVTGDARVAGLRWSADASRFAVVTFQDLGDAEVTRVWLANADGGDAQLAYSLLFDEGPALMDASAFDGRGGVWLPGWSWNWSPDGRTLLLDVRTLRRTAPTSSLSTCSPTARQTR